MGDVKSVHALLRVVCYEVVAAEMDRAGTVRHVSESVVCSAGSRWAAICGDDSS